jgi:glutathione S-transferase
MHIGLWSHDATTPNAASAQPGLVLRFATVHAPGRFRDCSASALPTSCVTLAWRNESPVEGEPIVKLYYLPGACSLASDIALREAGLKFELVLVHRSNKKAADGLDFMQVNPKGYVPALVLDDGAVLTENVAVLLYIAEKASATKPTPAADSLERYRLVEWLSFISTEIHKSFNLLFHAEVPQGAKEFARTTLTARLEYLQHALGSRSFLMGDEFSVADAYLFTTLRWGRYVGLDISAWAQLAQYHERIGARPAVKEALHAEGLSG